MGGHGSSRRWRGWAFSCRPRVWCTAVTGVPASAARRLRLRPRTSMPGRRGPSTTATRSGPVSTPRASPSRRPTPPGRHPRSTARSTGSRSRRPGASTWRRRTTPSTRWRRTRAPSCGRPTWEHRCRPSPTSRAVTSARPSASPARRSSTPPAARSSPSPTSSNGEYARPLPRGAQHVHRQRRCSTRRSTRRVQVTAAILQRTGLNLDDGNVVFGYGGNDGDCSTYHGWIVSVPEGGGDAGYYDTTATPNGTQGAVWMGGAAPEVDAAGNIWAATGNGSSSIPYDGSDSVIELSPGLAGSSCFAPSDWSVDNANDRDLGSSPPALLSNGTVLQVGKSQTGYLLNQADLGGIGGAARRRRRCASAATSTAGTPSSGPSSTCPAAAGWRPIADQPVPQRRCGSRRRGRPAADRGRRPGVVDRGQHALRASTARTAPPCSSSPSAARPTTSRRRRWATASCWRRRATRSSPSPARPGIPGPPSPPPPAPPELVLLAGRLRRGHLHLRQRRLLRLGRRPSAGQARRGHGADALQGRLLAGGLRRGHLQLRRRDVLRLHGRQAAEQAHRGHGRHAGRGRVLVGRLRRGHLQLRRRRLLRLHGRPAAEQADRRHGLDHATGSGTGWSPPTAASSASATPPSTAPWAASR